MHRLCWQHRRFHFNRGEEGRIEAEEIMTALGKGGEGGGEGAGGGQGAHHWEQDTYGYQNWQGGGGQGGDWQGPPPQGGADPAPDAAPLAIRDALAVGGGAGGGVDGAGARDREHDGGGAGGGVDGAGARDREHDGGGGAGNGGADDGGAHHGAPAAPAAPPRTADDLST